MLKYGYPPEHRDEVRQTQNEAAYQRYRRRSVIGRHAITIHRRHMKYQRPWGMFLALTLWMARLPLSHGPIVLRSPVNGSEARTYASRLHTRVLQLPEKEAHGT